MVMLLIALGVYVCIPPVGSVFECLGMVTESLVSVCVGVLSVLLCVLVMSASEVFGSSRLCMKVCTSCESGCVKDVASVGLVLVLFTAFVGVFSDACVVFVCEVVMRLAVVDGVCVGLCVVCAVDEECICVECVALSVVYKVCVGLECVVCEKCVDFCVV